MDCFTNLALSTILGLFSSVWGNSVQANRIGLSMITSAHASKGSSVWIALLFTLIALSLPNDATAEIQQFNQEPGSKLIIGTKHIPPFAYKNPDGQWTGISIELWKHLADELNLEYDFRERSLEEMLAELESGELDAAVAAISVTADRHQRVEFCHPHFTTGLGIAVSINRQASSWELFGRIVSPRMLKIIGAMIVVILICGLLFWKFERNVNENLFGGKRRRGIGMGVWWTSIMLMGHKGLVPNSIAGRLLAACAMVLSIILLSLLTGVISSILTVRQLDHGIETPSDLTKVRVVAVAGSTGTDYLRHRHIAFQTRPTVQEALQLVVDDRADALVYDQAVLKYLVQREFAESIQVLPASFNTQEYAIALQPESSLRKPLNEVLLRYRASDGWDDLIYRYLGD